ncbi:hypothetical protein ABZY06_08880 [Streptomyces sp. NPDC006540]|uniref:hypothetical protein n=1 Tax=Streptomyces sp. NPDC006540 TaxID=3155353 RepID=UPI0033A43CBF
MADGAEGREERGTGAGEAREEAPRAPAQHGQERHEGRHEAREGHDGREQRGPAHGGHEELVEELRGLGRGIRIPDVDGETMAERVLAQLLAESDATPATPEAVALSGPWAPAVARRKRAVRWLRRRWRALSVGLSGVLVVLVLTPPVRAAVADWFGFGGVEVHHDPTARPSKAAAVPWCQDPVGLAEAGRRAGFTPRVPGALGDPEAVSVAVGPEGRSVVSLCWREDGRTVRLDEFPARLDIGFAKQARLMPQWLMLGDDGTGTGTLKSTGLWFSEPHRLRFMMTDAHGDDWVQAERTAGPTLLWTTADAVTTLRLEGVASVRRAEEIAESAL